jgi:hypothetical protein
VIRRSTDLLPGLLRLAWAEWRHGSPDLDLLDLDLDLPFRSGLTAPPGPRPARLD